MGRNLGPLNIKDSYEGLVQISGSSRDTLTDGSGSVITNLDVTSSFALTASFAENVVPINTGSFMVTGSVVDATLTFTKGDASTFPLTIDNVANAVSASHALQADNALTATSASHAVNSDTAISSSYALTASFAENVSTPNLQEVTDVGATTTNAITLDGASTSQLSILKNGVNNVRFITNNSTNAIVLSTSGSQAARIDFSGIPGEIESTGDLTLDTQGGKVVATDISASGYVSASEFIGPLTGNATTATSASHALNADNAISASYAPSEAPFPYTGSADISGSIDLVGDMIIGTGNTTTLNGKNLVGGNGNTISSTATSPNVILGGNSNEITNGSLNIMLGGSDTQITSTGNRNAIINGWGGATDGISAGSNQTIIGGVVSNISATGTSNTIIGGRSGNISGGANKSVVVGGELNQVSGGERGVVIGGYGNNEQGGNGVILGGANNSTNTGQFIVVVGGSNNSITGTSENSVIIGGTGGSIASHNKSVILGGTSLATTKNDEVVVPDLSIYGETFISSSTLGTGSLIDNLGQQALPGNDSIEHIVSLTQAEYDALTPDVNTLYVISGSTAGGAAFPYTGSAQITGSLGVTGSIEQGETNSNLGTNTAILASGDSLISASVVDSSIISSTGSFISQASNYNNVILASELSSNVSTGAVYNSAIIASENTSFSGTGTYWNVANIATKNSFNNNSRFSAIIGGETNKLQGFYSNVIAGGSSNEMKQATNSTIGGGTANRIGTNTQTDRGFIGGGSGHLINGGDDGAILGGINADITSGHDRSVILGGNGLQSSKSDEVVVPNLDINGTVVQSVQALTITSNTASLDASTGQMFTLGLQNGVDTHLELSNQVAGQTFSLKITNNATSAGTITFDNQFDFEGGTPFTATAATNAVDILTFTTFDGSNVQCVGSKNFS